MFDGSLMAEALRARILLKLAEAKLGRRALRLIGSGLIIVGQWLKARTDIPPAPQTVESWEQ